ncbi:hypothetical protein [Micromonospora maritima]|uniref:hypothetical protein n=3 Tax=Micromonospora maritima TaxID=986711 RepID=UPI0031F0176F
MAPLMGQNGAGPLVGQGATIGGHPGAAAPAAPQQAAPAAPLAASLYKASSGASKIAARGQKARDEAEADAIRLKAESDARLAAEATREAARLRKEAAKEAAKEKRREAMGRVVGRFTGAVGRSLAYTKANADAVYSMAIYAATATIAAWSQAQVAHDLFQWSWLRSIGSALFIEGLSLAFALTGHKLRMEGERAWFYRIMTFAAAGFGAYVNFFAHYEDPRLPAWVAQLMATLLAASSVAGITLWEARTNARSRKAMRKAEKKDQPKARLGIDLLLRYPGTFFWAWSAQVAYPKVRTRDEAIRVGRQMRADRRERLAREAQEREALKVDAEIRETAKKAALKAAKKGEAGLVLTSLAHLAQYGSAALGGQRALEAGPSAPKAGLTIEGAVVAPEAGPRPPAHEAGPDPLAPTASGLRPPVGGPALVAPSAPAAPRPPEQEAGPRPSAPEADPASPEATGPRVEANPAGGPAAPGAGGQGAGVKDLGAARSEHEARIDELSAMFPDTIPSRRVVIAKAQELLGKGVQLRFSWTSNKTIDNALKALRERRQQAA